MTKEDKAVSRIGATVKLAGGMVGTAGGYTMAAAGVATCIPSAVGCALIPVGGAIAGLSYVEAIDAKNQLSTAYESTEGQRVLNSFNLETHQGDRSRINELGLDGAIALAQFGAAKFGFKALDKVFGDVHIPKTDLDKAGAKAELNFSGNNIAPNGLFVMDPMRNAINEIDPKKLKEFSDPGIDPYPPGTILYQAQRYDQKTPGEFFSTAKPVDSLDAEIMFDITRFGNNAEQIAVFKTKIPGEFLNGNVAGGTSTQVWMSKSLSNQYLEQISVDPLYIPALKVKISK